MGDSDFQPPEAPKPQNLSSWNLALLIMSSTWPHMPKLIHAALGV